MTYSILLRSHPSGGYVATALAWPGYMVEAPTKEEALEKIRLVIMEIFAKGEIVEVDIPAPPQPIIPSPYAETFGMFRDDPTFSEFMEEVDKYRQEQNQMVDD